MFHFQAIAIARAAVQEYNQGTMVPGFKVTRNQMIWSANGWLVRMAMDGTVIDAARVAQL